MLPQLNKENARRDATPRRADANFNDGEHYQFARLTAMFAAAIRNLIERFHDGALIQFRFPTVGH